MIDNSAIGRPLMLTLNFILLVFIFLIIYVLREKFIYITLSISMFVFRTVFCNWNILIMESYITTKRGLATGYLNTIKRLSSSLIPFTVFYLF